MLLTSRLNLVQTSVITLVITRNMGRDDSKWQVFELKNVFKVIKSQYGHNQYQSRAAYDQRILGFNFGSLYFDDLMMVLRKERGLETFENFLVDESSLNKLVK